MRREEGFVLSHDQFAIDMRAVVREPGSDVMQVSAVWFRREKRVLRACAGSLRAWFGPGHGSGQVPKSAGEFALLATRREHWASATCEARWDGSTFWAAPPMHPDFQRGYLEMLEPLLAGFPAVPGGYTGWWRFTDVF